MQVLKKPCKGCPFRKDCTDGWLGEERINEIIVDTVLGDKYFPCHKTTDLPERDQSLCAGKLLLESKVKPYGNKSTRMAIAFKFMPGGYEYLSGAELVFDTIEETIQHHNYNEGTT